MRALVTGGGGFIGSALAARLIADGHDVRVYDSFVTGSRDLVPPDAHLVEGDLADLERLRKVCEGVDVVFHNAALRSVARSVDDPVASDEANVRGTLHTLIAATESGCNKVIYASSSMVYGDRGEDTITEDLAPNPVSPYGVGKLAGELYCRAWTRLHGLPTISLRYFNVFGPRQGTENAYAALFPAFVKALLAGRAPEIHWDGEQSRDFTFVDDVVEANVKAAAAPREADGDVFNVGAGRARTVNEVYEALQRAIGIRVEAVRKPKRPGDVRTTRASIEKARRVLGWTPDTDWTQAVETTVEWFRSV